ncbi:hypothetical protein Tco_0568048 [Tanacetum coccineum]
MPPRRFKKKTVRKYSGKPCAKAIEKYEKTRAGSNNTGGSGSTNTRGTVVPEMHGCFDKTFMNGKSHSFKGDVKLHVHVRGSCSRPGGTEMLETFGTLLMLIRSPVEILKLTTQKSCPRTGLDESTNWCLTKERRRLKAPLEERFMLEIYQNATGATYIIMDHVLKSARDVKEIGHMEKDVEF